MHHCTAPVPATPLMSPWYGVCSPSHTHTRTHKAPSPAPYASLCTSWPPGTWWAAPGAPQVPLSSPSRAPAAHITPPPPPPQQREHAGESIEERGSLGSPVAVKWGAASRPRAQDLHVNALGTTCDPQATSWTVLISIKERFGLTCKRMRSPPLLYCAGLSKSLFSQKPNRDGPRAFIRYIGPAFIILNLVAHWSLWISEPGSNQRD